MSSDGPPAIAIPPGGELLKFVAIGRLAVSAESGELLPEKHRLVAHNFNKKDDPDPDWTKSIKSHVKAVMKRAGHKLTPGKRIRLKDDQQQYEVHILTDEQDGDQNKTLVFFAITAPNFPKYHSVPALLRDLKAGFYQTVDAGTLWNGGSVQRACQPYFQRLMIHYGSSPLLSVQTKVEQVKSVMESSVKKALDSVERLDEMDEKSDKFENQSKKFYKQSAEVKTLQKNSYRKIMCLVCCLIIAIVLYFGITTFQHFKNNSDDPPVTDGSSSTGMAYNMTECSTGTYNATSTDADGST